MNKILTAAFVAVLAILSFASPAPRPAAPAWQQVGTNKYQITLQNVSGVQGTPKLSAPSGANIRYQILFAGIAGQRVSWVNNSGTGYTPTANSYSTVATWTALRAVNSTGTPVGSTTTPAVTAYPRWYDTTVTYPNGTGGLDLLIGGSFGTSNLGSWTGDGNPFSVQVTPSHVFVSPSPQISLSSDGLYSVSIVVFW